MAFVIRIMELVRTAIARIKAAKVTLVKVKMVIMVVVGIVVGA